MKHDLIADYMNSNIVRLEPDMFVVEAAALLLDKGMMGGPVVDHNGALIGWVSEQECLHVTIQVVYHNQRIATVRDIMRTNVLAVRTDDDLLDLAQQMLQVKPKCYPVVDAYGKVKGIITRRDVLLMLNKKLQELGSIKTKA